jgi:hypothetical protein
MEMSENESNEMEQRLLQALREGLQWVAFAGKTGKPDANDLYFFLSQQVQLRNI